MQSRPIKMSDDIHIVDLHGKLLRIEPNTEFLKVRSLAPIRFGKNGVIDTKFCEEMPVPLERSYGLFMLADNLWINCPDA